MTPEPYYSDETVTVYAGECLDMLRGLMDGCVDAVVTDPPYGLEFMGKEWDAPWKASGVGRGARVAAERVTELTPRGMGHSTSGGAYLAAGVDSVRVAGKPFQDWCEEWARECLRVLKPGCHIVAFGGSRTWHRLQSGIEDAGFEIRDSIAWLYGSGFPKSLNLTDENGQRTGWGTALKPAFEPIVVGRKPLIGTVAKNVLAHGTGAVNIDGCRVGSDSGRRRAVFDDKSNNDVFGAGLGQTTEAELVAGLGRWPTNVLLDESQAEALDARTGTLTSGVGAVKRVSASDAGGNRGPTFGAESRPAGTRMVSYGDSGGASRFFPTFHYEAKAPTVERPRNDDGTAHPTVKPLDLMRWLVRLVTPVGGLVCDPFLGSGTTAEACVIEGFRCVGSERDPQYLPLIVARLSKPISPVLDFGDTA